MTNFLCVNVNLVNFHSSLYSRERRETYKGVRYPQAKRPIVIPPQKPLVTYPTVLGFAC